MHGHDEDITKVGFMLTELSQVIEMGLEKSEQHPAFAPPSL